MKKYVTIPLGICLFFMVVSGFFLYRKYLAQVETQKELMVWYVSDTKTRLEVINNRIKELPYIVMPIVGEKGMAEKDVLNLYAGNIAQLEQFYTNNHSYIKGISVYDVFGDVFNLFYDKKNETFIPDIYKPRSISVLRSETGMLVDNNSFSMILPVYHGNTLAGNVIVNIDAMLLFQELFKPYLTKNDVWPTFVLDEEILTLPFEGEWMISHDKDVIQGIMNRTSGFFSGWIKGPESSARIVTYYESLMVPEHYLGMAFSGDISSFVFSSLWAFAVIFVILAAMTVVVSYAFHRITVHNKEAIHAKDQEIRLLRSISQNLPVGIIVSKDNTFYAGNDCLFALLDGYISTNDIGRNMEEMNFPPKFFQQPEHEEFQDWYLCTFEKNGHELCLGRRRMNMYLEGVEYAIDAFWDITDLRHRVRSEMTKSELLSRVSADVKKTLSSTRDAVALLLQQYPSEQHIGYIHEITDDLSGLIDDVQDYADIEAGFVVLDEEPFNLVEEVKKVTDMYQAEVQRKGIELQAHVASSIVRNLVGDAQRFRQILTHLLDNAIKFTNEGTVRITLGTTELQDRKILVNCSVEDTGQGMSREKLKKLFSLDLSAENGKSMGLGIIIARKLVSIMGGTLRVTSPSPISTNPAFPGTQFLFSVNAYSDHPIDKSLDYSSIVSYHKLNVLLIASDPSQVQYLSDFMERRRIQSDVFVYNHDSSELLINKLIIDKNRYQLVVIAAATSELTFTIAQEIHKRHLSDNCLYLLVDAASHGGNYMKAKSLNMDYYSNKSDDLSIYDLILQTHFPNLSDKHTATMTDLADKNLQILIAENNELSQAVAQMIFNRLGLEIDLVQNGLSLVNQLNHKTYDIIFIDLKCPPNDGFEIAEILRQKEYRMPIIAMTSTLTKENLKRIADSGMNGHVPKPLSPGNIQNILLKWLA